MFNWLKVWFGACAHHNTTFPIRDRQVCNDCGMCRSYVIGYKPGKWYTALPDDCYRHQTVVIEQNRKQVSEGWR